MFKINYNFTFGFLFGIVTVVFISAINFNLLPSWAAALATAIGISTSFIASFKVIS